MAMEYVWQGHVHGGGCVAGACMHGGGMHDLGACMASGTCMVGGVSVCGRGMCAWWLHE